MKNKKDKNIKKPSIWDKLFVPEDDEEFEDTQEISTIHESNAKDEPINKTKDESIIDKSSKDTELSDKKDNAEDTSSLDIAGFAQKSHNHIPLHQRYEEETYDDLEDNNLIDPPSRGLPKSTVGLIVAIVILIITIIGALVFYLTSSPSSKVVVENTIGKTQEEVQKWCDDNKLDSTRCLFELEYSETIEEGQIISQSVNSETTLSDKDVIVFKVSQGKDPDLEVELPDFETMKGEEIQKWFEDNAFSDVTYEYEVNPELPEGTFLSINVTSTKVARSTPILIKLSLTEASNDMNIEVPDFKDYTKANIQAWASLNKITITFTEEYSDTIASGKVISQSLKAGETIKVGSKLTIVISKGKAITMENFVGKTKTEVTSWCNTNGLKCTFNAGQYSDQAKDTIVTQSVNSGTKVTVSTSITFIPSLGSDVTIGSYKDKSFTDFETQINSLNKQNAKLTIKKETEITHDSKLDNIVISNTETAKYNSEVTVKYYVYEAAKISVPNCSGSESAYLESLQKVGLKGSKSGTRYSTSTANGNVMSCSITSGEVTEGTSITYFVSQGAYNPSANDFNNLSDSDARNKVQSAVNNGASGWSYSSANAYNNDVAQGKTFGCAISGTKVTCSVSLGKRPVVDNYVGRTWEGTTNTWNLGNGITLKTIGSEYSDRPVNEILSQNIQAGTEVPDGGITIEVVLSKGPEPVIQPVTFRIDITSRDAVKDTKAGIEDMFKALINNSNVSVSFTYVSSTGDSVGYSFKSVTYTDMNGNTQTLSDIGDVAADPSKPIKFEIYETKS